MNYIERFKVPPGSKVADDGQWQLRDGSDCSAEAGTLGIVTAMRDLSTIKLALVVGQFEFSDFASLAAAPGHLIQMLSASYQPELVQCDVIAAGTSLDADATRSDDGKTLVLQVIKPDAKEASAQIALSQFFPQKPAAQVIELSGPLDAMNTADKHASIVPRLVQWQHRLVDGRTSYTFRPHSNVRSF